MLLVTGVVNVAVDVPEFKLPFAVATTPAGTDVDHAKVLGLILEVSVITAFAPEQMGPTVAGDVATGSGFTKTVAVETAGLHGPDGSFVVSVSIAFPVNPTGGVHVEFSELTFENVPPTFEVQDPLEAAPPILPFNVKL